jgi:hypothetical protein
MERQSPADEDIVAPAAAPVHADLNFVGLEEASEIDAGELCALVGVEHRRAPVTRGRFCDRVNATRTVEGDCIRTPKFPHS